MLTSNAQAEAQHVSAVIDDLSAKEAFPDAIVEDVGGTPKRSRPRARASGFSPVAFSPSGTTGMETAFERGAAQILLDGESCVNKKNEFLGTVCIVP
eukprot:5205450-Pleurochrysis_carterae.AAC.1